MMDQVLAVSVMLGGVGLGLPMKQFATERVVCAHGARRKLFFCFFVLLVSETQLLC